MTHAIVLRGHLDWRSAWRLRRLTRDRNRERLAASILRVIDEAESPTTQWLGAAIPVQRRAVLACRPELVALATRLRAPYAVYAQGVALASELLTDACSPLYQSNGDLRNALDAALAALDGHVD